mmetsp:Transcript_2162/g.5079  ORF Transcript_2162/g.5079 Transcript_2162/m.5079 type:complete len:96 (+) Transcript_2162:1000-1287(+)
MVPTNRAWGLWLSRKSLARCLHEGVLPIGVAACLPPNTRVEGAKGEAQAQANEEAEEGDEEEEGASACWDTGPFASRVGELGSTACWASSTDFIS